jgi:DNA mismatch repair protein MutS
LFAVPAATPVKRDGEADVLAAAIAALNPDEMSPREAMDALYALKARLPKAREG